jgi:Rieske Fe-S protein
MPENEDKYPAESGRRRFVKGVVGSATLAGLGSGTGASLKMATSPTGVGGGSNQYIGIQNTAGPAPRGMPMIPIEITSSNELKGLWPEVTEETIGGRTVSVAETDVGGITYSSTWFQYCGVQTYAGTQPSTDEDNFFRAAPGAPFDWMNDLEADAKMTVDMFSDYKEWGNGIGQSGLGKPAITSWRSQGEGVSTMPVQVLRSPKVSEMANGEGEFSDLPGPVRDFIGEATQNDFMAWLDKCTHFCCVPQFKAYDGSAKFGGEDRVYCQCHQSIYNPFSPVQKQFIALPRPEE